MGWPDCTLQSPTAKQDSVDLKELDKEKFNLTVVTAILRDYMDTLFKRLEYFSPGVIMESTL